MPSLAHGTSSPTLKGYLPSHSLRSFAWQVALSIAQDRGFRAANPVKTRSCKRPECGKKFRGTDPRKQYCSTRCIGIHKHAQEISGKYPFVRNCPTCDTPLTITAKNYKQMYCGGKCRDQYKTIRRRLSKLGAEQRPLIIELVGVSTVGELKAEAV